MANGICIGAGGVKNVKNIYVGVGGVRNIKEVYVGVNNTPRLVWQDKNILFKAGVANKGFKLIMDGESNNSWVWVISNINQLQYVRKFGNSSYHGFLELDVDVTNYSKITVKFEFLNVEGVKTANYSLQQPYEYACTWVDTGSKPWIPRLSHNQHAYKPNYVINNGNNAEIESIYNISSMTGVKKLLFSAFGSWEDGTKRGTFGYTLNYKEIIVE